MRTLRRFATGWLAGGAIALCLGAALPPVPLPPPAAPGPEGVPPGWWAELQPLLTGGARCRLKIAPHWLEPGEPARAGSLDAFGIATLQKSRMRVVFGPVKSRGDMRQLLTGPLDGLSSERPDLLVEETFAVDLNGDGRPGDWMLDHGSAPFERLELRGEGGAKGVRPGHTLPAFEAAIDQGANCLESPVWLTQDGIPVLADGPWLQRDRVRWSHPGSPAPREAVPDLQAWQLSALRHWTDRGVKQDGYPMQNLDPLLSPVSLAFGRLRGWADVHAWVDLESLLAFVSFYQTYYTLGEGRLHPEAAARGGRARQVQLVLSLPPSGEGNDAARRASATCLAIGTRAGFLARLTLQSTDGRLLAELARRYPGLQLCLQFP
ncbi:MAG: glycerophosphodiester phosphodiesterase family protein [Candidatus Sericytochromatia bacterium]|nr:glycerophosphodiester phosphodiesterase family protein [Candidatus Sericytochromatia bacterium]